MVAYAGAQIRAERLVFGGEHSLLIQSYRPRELLSGHVNADGWGVVWYRDARPVSVYGERPIWQATDLERLLETVQVEMGLAALRNVTPGVPYSRAGIPPIVRRGVAVVLNGYLQDFRSRFLRPLIDRLSDRSLSAIEGVSDTELLTLAIGDGVEAGAELSDTVVEVVAATLEMARSFERVVQLNLVASDGETVVAVRTSTESRSNSLYVGRRVALAPDGVLLASEPIDPSGEWAMLDEDAVVVMGPSDVTISRLPI